MDASGVGHRQPFSPPTSPKSPASLFQVPGSSFTTERLDLILSNLRCSINNKQDKFPEAKITDILQTPQSARKSPRGDVNGADSQYQKGHNINSEVTDRSSVEPPHRPIYSTVDIQVPDNNNMYHSSRTYSDPSASAAKLKAYESDLLLKSNRKPNMGVSSLRDSQRTNLSRFPDSQASDSTLKSSSLISDSRKASGRKSPAKSVSFKETADLYRYIQGEPKVLSPTARRAPSPNTHPDNAHRVPRPDGPQNVYRRRKSPSFSGGRGGYSDGESNNSYTTKPAKTYGSLPRKLPETHTSGRRKLPSIPNVLSSDLVRTHCKLDDDLPREGSPSPQRFYESDSNIRHQRNGNSTRAGNSKEDRIRELQRQFLNHKRQQHIDAQRKTKVDGERYFRPVAVPSNTHRGNVARIRIGLKTQDDDRDTSHSATQQYNVYYDPEHASKRGDTSREMSSKYDRDVKSPVPRGGHRKNGGRTSSSSRPLSPDEVWTDDYLSTDEGSRPVVVNGTRKTHSPFPFDRSYYKEKDEEVSSHNGEKHQPRRPVVRRRTVSGVPSEAIGAGSRGDEPDLFPVYHRQEPTDPRYRLKEKRKNNSLTKSASQSETNINKRSTTPSSSTGYRNDRERGTPKASSRLSSTPRPSSRSSDVSDIGRRVKSPVTNSSTSSLPRGSQTRVNASDPNFTRSRSLRELSRTQAEPEPTIGRGRRSAGGGTVLSGRFRKLLNTDVKDVKGSDGKSSIDPAVLWNALDGFDNAYRNKSLSQVEARNSSGKKKKGNVDFVIYI